jgi:hypothetical protein
MPHLDQTPSALHIYVQARQIDKKNSYVLLCGSHKRPTDLLFAGDYAASTDDQIASARSQPLATLLLLPIRDSSPEAVE